MAWQDQLQPGSFRGAPFEVLGNQAAFGRRGVLHEYPLRDVPWFEDLGQRARENTLDVVVLGTNYLAKRDALIAAIETAGPGLLVHPYYGEMQVAVTDCRVSESTDAGGVARFTITFVQAGVSKEPRAVSSTPDIVAAAAEDATAKTQAAYASQTLTKNQPDFVANSLRGRVGSLLSSVRSTAAQVQGAVQPLADLQQQVDAINGNLIALVYEPAALAQGLVATVKQLVRSVAVAPAEALQLAQVFWRFGPLTVSASNPSPRRAIEIANRISLSRLVRGAALAESARAAAELEFDSFDAAVALRDGITDAIDELLLATTDDASFDALRKLRTAAVADITARGADLARLVRYTPGATMPALLLAQRLYADGAKADDVLARNQVRIAHPLFVRGGVTLEVLADE